MSLEDLAEQEVQESVVDTPETPAASIGETDSQNPAELADTTDADPQPSATETDAELSDTADAEQEAIETIELSRYKSLQAEYTRNRQADKARDEEMLTLRQQVEQFSGIDPQAVSAYKQQQELPVWNPTSPRHQQFMAAQERLKVINSLDLTPEQKQTEAARHLSDAEMQEQISWGTHQRQEQQRMMQDPQGYISGLVEQRVQQTVQSQLNGYHSTQQTQGKIQQMFSDPEFKSVYLDEAGSAVSEWGAKLNDMLGQGIPYETADSMLRSQRELQNLKSENIELRKRSASSDERDRLLRDGATDMREVRTGGGDIYEEASAIAKQRGIRLDSDAGLKLLQALESKTAS